MTLWPSGVRLTPGALLSNNSTPRRPCRRLICALTAGCVMPCALAARVKLRNSTTGHECAQQIGRNIRHAAGLSPASTDAAPGGQRYSHFSGLRATGKNGINDTVTSAANNAKVIAPSKAESRSCPFFASISASSVCSVPRPGSPSCWRRPISRLPCRNSSSRCCSAASSTPCPARCRRDSRRRAGAGAARRRLGRLRPVHHRRRRAGGVVLRPAGAPPPQPGAGGLFRARPAAAAGLPRRRPFRPADEGHAHRHRYAVVAVGVVLPRAFRRLRLHLRAAAGDA